jgi:hypothetical protein
MEPSLVVVPSAQEDAQSMVLLLVLALYAQEDVQ